MENHFYTYAYLDQHKRPYYIGKGHGNRAYKNHSNTITPSKDKILILKTGLTEKDAVRHEEYMISVYGRCHNAGMLKNKLDRGWSTSLSYSREDPDEWANPLVSSIFGNRTAACVLLFINQQEESHGLRIAKVFGFGLNQVQRQLKRLEENYILSSRKIGPIRVYSFNRGPLAQNLRTFLDAIRPRC